MSRFTFSQSAIPIDIEDQHFEIPFNQGLFEKKDKLLKEAQKTLEATNADSDEKETLDRAFKFFRNRQNRNVPSILMSGILSISMPLFWSSTALTCTRPNTCTGGSSRPCLNP